MTLIHMLMWTGLDGRAAGRDRGLRLAELFFQSSINYINIISLSKIGGLLGRGGRWDMGAAKS